MEQESIERRSKQKAARPRSAEIGKCGCEQLAKWPRSITASATKKTCRRRANGSLLQNEPHRPRTADRAPVTARGRERFHPQVPRPAYLHHPPAPAGNVNRAPTPAPTTGAHLRPPGSRP